ncbi:MAG: NADH/ubiquinone/plastoquinone (complex I) [delta proteobacterium MLS_D]|jgi:multicomponent Na+:H+ antiporter subunit D|nr:MAG: NADH/ubiquinone/plastoquinone (complex I) [delta proteobacterium MLS_D]
MVENAPVLIPVIYMAACMLISLTRLRYRWLAYPMALAATVLASATALGILYHVTRHGSFNYYFGGWVPPIGIEYVIDPLSAFVLTVINIVAGLVLYHSLNVNRLELGRKVVPYYAVAMLLMLGLNGIVLTGDFFNLFVFLEISSLASYGLIAVGERGSAFAAFRYLILGTVGASFYLLGLGFLHLNTGSLNMADLAAIIPNLEFGKDPAIVIALVMMTVGICIKMAIFPLHGWLPDAYTLAPSTSSALIAPIGTKVASYILIRTLFFVYGVDLVTEGIPVTTILGWLSAIGIIYGSILAIAQSELKRMLAYSSIAQIGYIGLGISMANPLGFIGAVLHVLNHAFMKACLFLVAANLRTQVGHSDISRFDDSYRVKMPWTMAAFTTAAISMVGLPPLAGFFSKWYLALATIENSQWVFLAVILISSLLNAVYFFRVIEKVYMKSPSGVADDAGAGNDPAQFGSGEPTSSMVIPVLVFAAALLLIGIFNALIVTTLIQPMMPPGM